MEENNNRKIYWTPLKAVTPYTWYRHARFQGVVPEPLPNGMLWV
jgi:hypothetical protein